jgi:hypothetical protein
MAGRGYEHACFISYKRIRTGLPSVRHFYRRFVDAFQTRLREYLTLELFPYFDAEISTGVDYAERLPERLCKSLCLVAILTPEYFESTWCVSEWRAMEALERKRVPSQKQNLLIIPILLRGDLDHAIKWCGTRKLLDLRTVRDPMQQMSTVRNRTHVEEIAKQIQEISRVLADCECTPSPVKLGPDVVVVNPDNRAPNPVAA